MKLLISIICMQAMLFSYEYCVVVNNKSQIAKLSTKQVKDIYMKKRNFINGQKVIPVNMSANSDIRETFEKNILKMNKRKLNKYWTKQHFQGVRPPLIQSSKNSMKLFVKKVDASIGYLHISDLDENLRVVYEF